VFAWLVIACGCKRWLDKLSLPAQYASGSLLGAVCGLYSAALAAWAGIGSMMGWGGSGWPVSVWLGSVLAGALLGWLLVAGLVARARALTPAATRARLDELQSRIRPHFLFNALNSAIALVRDDPKRAEAVLEDLSELFRSALANPEQATTLGDEVELAQRYLAIEAVRFGERMQVDWSLDSTVAHVRMPPLVLQPLVENAVRHGVEPTDARIHIKVSTLRRGDNVVIRVTNTLDTEAPTRAGNGIALANVRERLKLMHDVRSSFHAQHVDGVFQSRIEVPFTDHP
jgi:two-component system, LytTR family, sensor histidine kinase AlgZ